jgi:acetoin:2,6-dichlorophenolindophenol oxidoreductase subunit alpha
MTDPDPHDDRRSRLLALYRQMRLLRRLDERLGELVRDQSIRGPMHLGIGQEAAGIGATATLRPGDITTATHRPHAQYVGLCLPLGPVVAEMMGRAAGQCRGRAGHMLIADSAHGLLGPSGVVGHSLLYAIGHGYAQKLRGDGNVTLCVTGDGAVNSGAFNEALNMMALWQLPVVVLVENNQYALSIRIDRHVREQALFLRAAGYGIPGVQVDGNDVEAVYETVLEAVTRARAGGGPGLVEAITYRNVGFSSSDRGGYHPAGEAARFADPLAVAADRLARLGVAASTLDRLHAAVEGELADAVAFAEASSWPDPAEAIDFAVLWDAKWVA